MAGGFTVTISAVDKLTATLNDINKKTRETARPFRNLQASVQRFVDVSGVRNVGNAFRDVGRGARDAFDRIASIVAPLGAITGAASLAGMYRMISAWSEWGSQLRNSSQSIGIAAQKLSAWEGAAQIGGAAAGSMTNALKALGQNMYDAVGGRNAQFTALMNGWGISFRKSATEGKNVADVFPQIADRIAKLKDPFAQAQAATMAFGGAGEALLPWIRRGSAGMREYEAEARKYLHVTKGTADGADKFRMSQTRLTLAVQGLGNQMAERLAPSITPILDKFSNWLATSPQVTKAIDTMGQAVQDFSGWLQSVDWNGVLSGMKGWVQSIKSVVDWLGGPKKVLEGLFVLMGAKFVFSMVAPWVTLGKAIVTVIKRLGWATLAMEKFTDAEEGERAASSFGKSALARAGLAAAAGLATHEGLKYVDPEDRVGTWIDTHIPGASWLDNAASHVGMGRNYAQQYKARGEATGIAYRAGQFLKDAGVDQQHFDVMKNSIAGIENARYGQMGGYNYAYAGRYQMGRGAISDAAKFLGVPVPSRQQFLGDPQMQERFFEAYTDQNYKYLMSHNKRFAGMSANERLAILGRAHNQGAGATSTWLNTGERQVDGNGYDPDNYRSAINENLSKLPSGPPMQVASVQSGGQQSLDGTLSIKVQSDAGLKTSTVNQAGAFKTAKVAHSSVGEDGI